MDSAPSNPKTDASVSEEAPKKGSQLKRIILGILILTAVFFGMKAWLHARTWVSTDDAFIAAHVERVSTRVAGRVTAVLVKDNQMVHSGDTLVELDDRDFQVAVQQAEASLASANAEVAKAQAQHLAAQAATDQAAAKLDSAKAEAANAELELSRSEKLRKSGAVAQQNLDTALKLSQTRASDVVAGEKQVASLQAGVVYTLAALEAAKAAVAKAEADLAKAQLQLSYTKIPASQDGRVTVKSVEPGNFVQPGQALMAIVSNEVWVEANLKETQLDRVRVGQEAIIRVDAYPELELHGRVDSIQAGSGAEFSLLPPENATGNYVKVVQRVPVKITFDPNTKDLPLLGPGMSVVPEIRVR